MMLEALNFIATLVISGRRRPAEINASVRLWARARRCARDWAPHEQQCWAFVLAARPAKGRVAVVLGSGLLRDVAVAQLSSSFDEVRLYDLQHLASVRLWAMSRRLGNLRFIERDLSDGLDFLHGEPDIDLVISANLLSQLGVAADRIGVDAAAVISTHIEGLKAAPGCRLLLTDVAFDGILKDGMVAEQHDLMRGVALPAPSARWSWTVAPYGELDPGYKAVHEVVGIQL